MPLTAKRPHILSHLAPFPAERRELRVGRAHLAHYLDHSSFSLGIKKLFLSAKQIWKLRIWTQLCFLLPGWGFTPEATHVWALIPWYHCVPEYTSGLQTEITEASPRGTLKGPLPGTLTSSLLGFISTLPEVISTDEKMLMYQYYFYSFFLFQLLLRKWRGFLLLHS